ncbi:MAG: hypothetical protein FD180_5002 [Planctomycetota bacterium]|nr:MAG: hypothetical protein FD180_5002 [Planctomycetota bacterium]
MAQPPPGRPPANRPSAVRPAGAPVPAKPAPGTQRVAAVPPGAIASAGPPSSKAKMLRPAAPSPIPPAEKKPMSRKRLMFNLFIYLSIPASIVVIVWRLKVMGAKKLAENVKGAVGVGENPNNVGPQVTDEQKQLDEIQEKYLKVAQTKYAVAELKTTAEDKKLVLWKEIVALDEAYIRIMTPILEDPRYTGDGWQHLSKGVEEAGMRLRVLRDRIRSTEPPEEVKKAEPNTQALGAISGWNGTTQKLAIIFLPKTASPTEPTALGAEFAQNLGQTGAELKDLPVEWVWALIKGTAKDEIDKLDAAGKKAKCEELAKGIQVFDSSKFQGEFGYLKSLSGYYYKDLFARARVQVHDDRGVTAFKEYYDLVLRAIGTPVKGWQNVSAGLCEYRLTWRKDGVVYRLNGIGTKNGMDLTFTAYNEANWKALAEERGDKDVFEEEKQEDWADKTPTAPPE